jgi:2-methylcitrate dehydratase PrpD
MTTELNTSMALAEELIALDAGRLSPEDFDQLERLLLDHAAVTLCGSIQPWGRALTDWARQYGSGGKAVLAGCGEGANASAAALVNGTSAHGYELDDTHDKSMSHPGAVVISAALAVGAEIGANGRDLLAAIVAGYEAMARIGMAATPVRVIEKGFHPTGTFGVFGAAAAAGKLLGLSPLGLAHAWGIALSMSSGSCQFAFEPRGTMVKRMHAGIPAHNGVIAAQLAKLGIAAPVQAIEGEFGFLKLIGEDADLSFLAGTPGAPLEIHNISIKPYSCCRKFHSLIDALDEVTEGFKVDTDAIAKITVRSPETAVASHLMRRPDSVMAAQYSMPYIVGATLAYGPRRYDAYGESHHADPRILSIVDKVESVHDADLDPVVPAKMPNRVEIELRGGEIRQATVMDSLGTPVHPMSTDGVLEKAHALLDGLDQDFNLQRIVAAVHGVADAKNIRALTESLVLPGYEALAVGPKAA